MQKLEFGEKLDLIVQRDSRYDREAYHFLREALEYTVKQRKKAREGTDDHVTGQQLLEGIRLYALKEFGPMVPTVLLYWGIRRCEDFGEMVYNFIREGIFGKTETDSIEDFGGGYNFHDAFVVPFLPEKSPVRSRRSSSEIAEELR
ncbi:MAG TPA: Minf_1886 family protein [Chthoniobacter sp.]|jgi:uncharacterized repeat protein (TIGR04138 family)